MGWKTVAKKLAKHGLNLLSTAIPGGSFISSLVSDVLGCDNNAQSIDTALQNATPEQLLKLREIQEKNKYKLQEIIMENETARVKAVNNTMQVESASDKWWQSSWRPFWGFISAMAFLTVCIFVCILAYKAIITTDTNAMMMIPQFITTMTALFAVPGAVLGITAWQRGKEKLERIKR